MDVVFASHHWPTWNDDDNLVVKFLSEQRDYYAYLHNESLRQINAGQSPKEIAENIQMPPTLSTKTNLQGYYGSISHDPKAVYDKYIGWFDGNPAYLWPLQPTDEATEFVTCVGGNQAVLDLADGYMTKKNFRFAATLLDKLVFAKQAMTTLASVYTTLGYGSENGIWRNNYLTGAYELQFGSQNADHTISPEALLALRLDELLDTVAIVTEWPATIANPKVYLEKEITIDFMVSDVEQNGKPGASWHLRLSNAALTGHAIPYVAPSTTANPGSDLTIWSDHINLVKLIGAAALGESPVIVDNSNCRHRHP
jgi:alkyl sulfatase BDS1-like metallo-beta-lactamase superfamily hydrolase